MNECDVARLITLALFSFSAPVSSGYHLNRFISIHFSTQTLRQQTLRVHFIHQIALHYGERVREPLLQSYYNVNLTPKSTSKRTSKSKAKPEPAFTLFPKLPAELRKLVWGFALPGPKIVTIFAPKPYAYQNQIEAWYKIPAMLHTCHESRVLAQKAFDRVFGKSLGGNPVYFDFNQDALFFDGVDAMELFFGWESGHPPANSVGDERLRFFAMRASLHRYICQHVYSGLGSPEYFVIARDGGGPVPWRDSYVEDTAKSQLAERRTQSGAIDPNYTPPKISCLTMIQLQKLLVSLRGQRSLNDSTG